MERIYSQILYEMEDGHDSVLVTIVGDQGSAPRHAGAEMLVNAEGIRCGTIGGGAVELQAEALAKELMVKGENLLKEYALKPSGQDVTGMACGGDVTLLFSYIAHDDQAWKALAQEVCDKLNAVGRDRLMRPLDGSVPTLVSVETMAAEKSLSDEEKEHLKAGETLLTENYYSCLLNKSTRVLIFGAGHISKALVPLLKAVNFSGVVFDDRPEFATKEDFPDAEEIIVGDFNKISDYIEFRPDDFVVIMTSGHAHDREAEEQALRAPHAYLGVIGSRKKIAYVNSIMKEKGFTDEELATVHTPIGVSIKAVTPAEIAISILGELILCRAENKGR